MLGPNHPDWVAGYYGIPEQGSLLCFLNHRLSADELASQILRADVRLLIGAHAELASLERRLSSLSRPPQTLSFGSQLDPPDLDQSRGPGSASWLLFTSGTTGSPKGALLSANGLVAALDASRDARPIEEDDIFLFPFPLCHVAGYNVLRLHRAGRPVVLIDRFEPTAFIDAVEREQVTSTTLAATMLAALLDHLGDQPADVLRLRTLRTVAYGASPMPADLLRRVDGLLGVQLTQGYGMTELSGNAVFLDALDHRRGLRDDSSLLAAAGRPGPGVTIELRNDDGERVTSGSTGEIFVQAEQIMLGYLDDADATSKAIQDGWLATGDVGRIRPDGCLEIVDRVKDIIVTGGENVASLEVEVALRAVCPELSEIAVIGVPDPTWGENVCAVAVLAPGAQLELDVIARRLDGHLAGYKIPRHLVLIDAMPLTHSGKVAKAELRSALAAEPHLAGVRRSSRAI